MRLNRFLALATGISRRAADKVIKDHRVTVNDRPAELGLDLKASDVVMLDGAVVQASKTTSLLLNKPVGYVTSRSGQGSRTIYDLLPNEYHNLKPVGRLDKDSSGLLLLTNDGELANRLTHPRYSKTKVYQIKLDKQLEPIHQQMISDHGIQLDDGRSQLSLQKLETSKHWRVTMSEGRNRQIRRTFASLGYEVTDLTRIKFGEYNLKQIKRGQIYIMLGVDDSRDPLGLA